MRPGSSIPFLAGVLWFVLCRSHFPNTILGWLVCCHQLRQKGSVLLPEIGLDWLFRQPNVGMVLEGLGPVDRHAGMVNDWRDQLVYYAQLQ